MPDGDAVHHRARRRWDLMKRPRPQWRALVFYLVLGLLTAGWHAVRNPTGVCACVADADTSMFMWSLKWWPYALLHGLNPLVSHYVWAPTGDNITRRTVIPAASLILAPVTALFGVVVSYNVMSIASPVLAAFTSYLLCRRLVGRELPALAGGYLFGFGPYQFTQLVAHPNLSLVFLIPVMVHLGLRRANGEISRRLYVGALGATLALQLGLSSEVLSTAGAMGIVMLLAGYLLAPAQYRAAAKRVLTETAGAGLLAVVVSSPFLYYALVKGGAPHDLPNLSDMFGLDVLNPFFPTQTTWLGHHDFRAIGLTFEGGNYTEAGAYLSLPIILAFVLWITSTRRRFLARMVVIATVVSVLAALGSHFQVAGTQAFTLPYDWIKSIPVIKIITPSRIFVYTALAVAVGVAAWLSESHPGSLRGAGRWLVFGLGAVMIFPNIGSGLWSGTPNIPTFFSTTAYRRYLNAGETVLVLPYGLNDMSMLWQAETDFYFRMPEGYLGHLAPQPFASEQIVNELLANKVPSPVALRSFLRSYQVKAVVIHETGGAANLAFADELSRLGLRGTSVGGVVAFHIPAAGPFWSQGSVVAKGQVGRRHGSRPPRIPGRFKLGSPP
ncbi:MAG: hypothetical protein ABSG95_02125 [Solirubrobacteraceae bacterium]|jgi:hypothetical protein